MVGRWFAVLLIFCHASTASAQQQVTLAETRFDYMPESRVDAPAAPDVAATRIAVTGKVPIPLNRQTTVIATPLYRAWRLASDDIDDRTIHELGLVLGARYQLSDTWSFFGIAGLGIASDFEQVDAEHLRTTGAIAVNYTHSPRLQIGLGAASTYAFGELLALPLITATWRPADALSISVNLPSRVDARYRFAQRFEAGALFAVEGNQFSVSTPAGDGSLALSVGAVMGRLGARVAGPLWVVAAGGVTVFRRIEPFDANGTSLGDVSGERAPLFSLSFELRVDVLDRPTKP